MNKNILAYENKIGSRCGLHCTGCSFKESHGCGGCIETMGHPFHGECKIAVCCQAKGLLHCGECDIIPCSKLYAYSYLDPEHGDKPQGARVELCRRWAAEDNKQVWTKVLLTCAGFEDVNGKPMPNIIKCFYDMLEKPAGDAKVLFIPVAAVNYIAKKMAQLCKSELLHLGILPENITAYYLDKDLSEAEAMSYDVIYFTGGDTGYLLRRIKESGFDLLIKKMVFRNKVYVGVSAGSLIATPNIGDPYNEATAGLCLVNTYLSVHCTGDEEQGTELPLPHIALADHQALAVTCKGYRVIEG